MELNLSELNLSELNGLAKSGIWKGVPGLAERIFARLTEHLEQDDSVVRFGNDAFWARILNEDGNNVHPNSEASTGLAGCEYSDIGAAAAIQSSSQQSAGEDYGDIIGAVLPHSENQPDSDSQQRPGPSGLQQGGRRLYTIKPLEPKESPKFKLRRLGFTVAIHEELGYADFYELLLDTIDEAFAKTQGGKVGLEIRHPVLAEPIEIPFSDADKLNATTVANAVDLVLQSRFFLFNGDLCLEYTIIGGNTAE